MRIRFKGIFTKENELTGVVNSAEIINNFTDVWIPGYQRQRLNNSSKVVSLKRVFTEGKSINAVQWQFKGTIIKSKADPNDMILDGEIEVMDGQQRTYALFDSGVINYQLPVQIYINREKEEQIEQFHRYNTTTALNLADFMLSFEGLAAKFIQKQMKKSPKVDPDTQIPLSRTGNNSGLAVGTGGVLLFWAYYRTVGLEQPGRLIPRTKYLKTFFQDETITDSEMRLAAFAYQNLCKNFIEFFGSFDHSSSAYKRAFFLAWNLLVVRNFMSPTGHIEMRRFKSKGHSVKSELFGTAKFKEIKLGFSDESIEAVYDMLVRHFNYKIQKDPLAKFAEINEQHNEALFQQIKFEKLQRRGERANLTPN